MLKIKSPEQYQSTSLQLLKVFSSFSLFSLLSHSQQTFLVFQDVLKTSSAYQYLIFQDIFKTSFKTYSSRRLQYRRLARKSWRCLQRNNISSFKMSFPHAFQDDVFKMSSRRAFKNTSCKHVLKTSWKNCLGRRHEDVLEGNNILPWRCLEDVFNMPPLKRVFAG